MTEKQRTVVDTLLDKASAANDAAQAINFAQAACNAANALRVLTEIDRSSNAPHEAS
jgi:hypothetical protein